MIDKIWDNLIDLLKKVLPEGKSQEVILAIETVRAKSRQPLALSIIAITQLVIWQGKSITYRIMKIVYFGTYEWWVDVVFLGAMISFLFGIPFIEIMKALKSKPK